MPTNLTPELKLQFEQIINNMPQEGQFTLPWLCELMGKARDMDRWVDVKTPPDNGIEVLGYSPGWIDLDFNPEGRRICFINDDGEWFSAAWWDYQDCYISKFTGDGNVPAQNTVGFIDNSKPTKWQPVPNAPTQAVRKDGEG